MERKNITIGGKKVVVELGHTLDEWNSEMHDCDDNLWSFPIEEMIDGTIEPMEDIVYWLIDGRLYETDTPSWDEGITARITFRSEVYVTGKDIDEIQRKWHDLHIFSTDALVDYGAEVVELTSIERVDDESYEELHFN